MTHNDQGEFPPTLLSQIAPTDPAILKSMADGLDRAAHYAAIGRVAANWNEFEAAIDVTSAFIADLDEEIAACFTAQMIGVGPKSNALLSLMKQTSFDSKACKELEKFFKERVIGLSEQRNRAVHDVWHLENAQQPTRFEVTAKKTLRYLRVDMPTKDLITLANNIQKLKDDFVALVKKGLNAQKLSSE
ncbi:hypothetical protein V6B08_21180 [Ferrovibrio sp. MS7]|uniref:hypothetical protein n=1 Tax=Ferrovibrio plantarum TaxID=3119164 RepID=UPI0031373A71